MLLFPFPPMWLFPFPPMWFHRRDLKWLNLGGSITLLKMFRCTSKPNYHYIDLNSLSYGWKNGKAALKLFWKATARLLFECNSGGPHCWATNMKYSYPMGLLRSKDATSRYMLRLLGKGWSLSSKLQFWLSSLWKNYETGNHGWFKKNTHNIHQKPRI